MKQRHGFGLIEVILAVSVFALAVTAIIGIVAYGTQTDARTGARSRALAIAEEGIEAVRNMRDADFTNLAAGTHGLALVNNAWTFSGTQDITDIFTRSVEIQSIDANRALVTSQVSWTIGGRAYGPVSVTGRLANWRRSVATPRGGGMLVYADYSGTDDVVRYRLLDENSGVWSAEQTVLDKGVPGNSSLRYLSLSSSPTRDEKILLTRHARGNTTGIDDNFLYAQVWNGSSWGNTILLESSDGAFSVNTPQLDGDYLANGDFLVVYAAESATPKYRIWNGSTWSAATALPAPSIGIQRNFIVRTIQETQQAMIAIRDANGRINTTLWNNGAVSAYTQHTTAPGGMETMKFDWISFSPPVGALLFSHNSSSLATRLWNNASWGNFAYRNNGIVNVLSEVKLGVRRNANSFLGCGRNSAGDIFCMQSNATPEWQIPTTIGDNVAAILASSELTYESQSLTTALVVYSQGALQADRAFPKWRTFNAGTNTWSAENALSSVTSELWKVFTLPNPTTDDIMVVMQDSSEDVWTVLWDGATNAFLTSGPLALTRQGQNSDHLASDNALDFAWDRF